MVVRRHSSGAHHCQITAESSRSSPSTAANRSPGRPGHGSQGSRPDDRARRLVPVAGTARPPGVVLRGPGPWTCPNEGAVKVTNSSGLSRDRVGMVLPPVTRNGSSRTCRGRRSANRAGRRRRGGCRRAGRAPRAGRRPRRTSRRPRRWRRRTSLLPMSRRGWRSCSLWLPCRPISERPIEQPGDHPGLGRCGQVGQVQRRALTEPRKPYGSRSKMPHQDPRPRPTRPVARQGRGRRRPRTHP